MRIVDRSIQPVVKLRSVEDHRHPVVKGSDKTISSCRQDGKGLYGLSFGRFPGLPYPRHGKRRTVRQRNVMRNLTSWCGGPLVVPAGRHDAAPGFNCLPESGFLMDRFATGVDQLVADGGIVSAVRHQTPANEGDRAAAPLFSLTMCTCCIGAML